MKFLSLLTVLMMWPVIAQAALERYDFDKAHTQIVFFVDHLGFSNSHGYFTDFEGHFNFDEANPISGGIEISIKTASINMVDDTKWNNNMRSADFFDVEKFPTMDFKSTGVELTGDKTAKLSGDLTLLGVSKPVVLDVAFNKVGKNPFSGKQVAGFSARGMIKRSDFGMNYGLPMIGDDVELRIEVEGILHNSEE